MSKNRLEILSFRPSSFFMEPSAYFSFMICPLSLAIIDKKIIWAFIMILSIFLTTSTTGLIGSFILLGVYILINRRSKKTIIYFLMFALALLYFLTQLNAFDVGVEKYNNIDSETNVRLTQGKYVVGTMKDAEYVFGVPYSSAFNYCKSGRAPSVIYYGDSVFMPSFWEIVLNFGVIGLALYLHIFYRIVRNSKITVPVISCLLITMFSGGIGIGPSFVFTLSFLLVIMSAYPTALDYKKSITSVH